MDLDFKEMKTNEVVSSVLREWSSGLQEGRQEKIMQFRVGKSKPCTTKRAPSAVQNKFLHMETNDLVTVRIAGKAVFPCSSVVSEIFLTNSHE